MTAEMPVAKGLTLYHLTDDLAQLLSERIEMAEAKEDTAEIDNQIAAYVEALPEKGDAVARILRHLETQAVMAKVEADRLNDRRRQFEAARERLEAYVCNVLERLPKPKKGSRKLEGATATLSLVGNGGAEPLDIQSPELVPDELCEAVVRMPWAVWDLANKVTVGMHREVYDVQRVPSNKLIREALKQPCWLCGGKGGDCDQCGGTGNATVPGARLLERGSHLKIS